MRHGETAVIHIRTADSAEAEPLRNVGASLGSSRAPRHNKSVAGRGFDKSRTGFRSRDDDIDRKLCHFRLFGDPFIFSKQQHRRLQL